MCNLVIVNGVLDIESIREFIEYFEDISKIYMNPVSVSKGASELFLNSCLCPINIDRTFTYSGIIFTWDGMNYLVERET